jgi:hypothetical protein
MSHVIARRFRAPYAVPNGVQMTPAGLWVVDQITDRVALIDPDNANEYGVTRLRREITTESSNTSGLTWGGGLLWLAANGPATLWRSPRPTDAQPGQGEILAVDPETGATVSRHPIPGGGGVHGIEYDPFEVDTLWITTLHEQTLTAVRIEDWSVQRVLALPFPRAHGVVRTVDGVWVVHTSHRIIVKLNVDTGAELARVEIPTDLPEPHCLTQVGETMVYCDATTGWLATIHGMAQRRQVLSEQEDGPSALRPVFLLHGSQLLYTPNLGGGPAENSVDFVFAEKAQTLAHKSQFICQTQPAVFLPVMPGISRTPHGPVRAKCL